MMNLQPSLVLALGLLGQAAPPSPAPNPDDPAARLAFMERSVSRYDVRATEGNRPSFRLRPDPVFRLNNPVSGVKDGAIFFWTEDGRPMASVQVFVIPSGVWLHEFTSLSPAPFVATLGGKPAWSPARPGVEFRRVPDAPRPAETPEARLRQMRALAEDFSAEDYFEEKSWQRLRLLPKPLARYGRPGTDTIDGALFGFVLGTDPEVFLIFEARPGGDGPSWQYAFAPMTAYALKGSWKGKATWSLPWRVYAKDSNAPFFIRDYSTRD